MSVQGYSVSLLQLKDCPIRIHPDTLVHYLKAWRNGQETVRNNQCTVCSSPLPENGFHFAVCCNKFHYRASDPYHVRSIALPTPGYSFTLPNMARILQRKRIHSDQEFLVLPDPIYWQVSATLEYEKIIKFVGGRPMTKRSKRIQPASKASVFYKQAEEAALNHGSLFKRSSGKNSLYRQIAFGKRSIFAVRGMIVPNPNLRPNEIIVPEALQELYGIVGQWVILNRMPSLQPENYVAVRVVGTWKHAAIGVPLEFLKMINGDFDGDEVNLYLMPSLQSQAECEALLDSATNMGSFTMGIKLYPCQDLLVAYHLFGHEIDFIPHMRPDWSLQQVLRVNYDLHGSRATFQCFDRGRQFYLRKQEEYAFGITFREILELVALARDKTYEQFQAAVLQLERPGCLVIQVRAGAKGSLYHLYQLVGSIGDDIGSSFYDGLKPWEAVLHSKIANVALIQSNLTWQPGYFHTKCIYNAQSWIINYRGHLVDGTIILEECALLAIHHLDYMSQQAFTVLLETVLINGEDV